ncbi:MULTISPECIES: type VII secretion-associated serine protease mycosin [unclassified Streptomyces]|uniref:type VII secretion-associated serine protease mycosin n=1 Tax=unclassified Streptomyces TaxID=2593676 RepID=UPI002DDAD008|nr:MULTISPECIES: type VII secretion-associated serine protease mycosin [unclassified Streptomyces]WSC29922.1 type VII secretion-associated serine protease mycosin [Streptomyces sp. NBC_01768]WSP48780.1 type VII secretion-associated serine protease mycosin [Streptomyces sp. NBC_01243]WSX01780.1 type VII secretion-associated serine protease mycosin [Streptomyces sp. NBC_00987]
MRSSSSGVTRRRTVVSIALGLMLVGVTPLSAHADSVRSRQWHLDAMKAEGMWAVSSGEKVTVAVIDSGVDSSNPDLLGQVLKGKDLAPDSSGDERVDYNGHGTGIAGLIAGTGESGGGDGAFGLAPGAKILPIRMRDDTGKVNGATGSANFNRDLAVAIRYAADNGAEVINVSLGNEVGTRQLSDAVKYALDKGSLIFAAAGNSGDKDNLLEYPAGTPGVVGVASIGKNLATDKTSQHGPQVDLSAPGVGMIHACGGGSELCETSGTSDATAIASASAALIWSKHPDWTNNQVLRVMLNTASGPADGAKRNDYVGYGGVRPRIALKTPGAPGPADVYPLPDLVAAESPSPSAKRSKAAGGSTDTDKPAAAPASDDKSSKTDLWIGLGIGAVALVGGAAAALAIRSRRHKPAAAAPPAYAHQPPYPHPYPQSQPQQQPAHPTYAPPPADPPGSSSRPW